MFEKVLQALRVLWNVRVDFAVGAFEVGICDQAGSAMAWTSDVDHIEIVFLDQAIQMDIDKIQSRSCTPMAEEARLDMR